MTTGGAIISMDIERSIHFENAADSCWGRTQTYWHNTTTSCSCCVAAAGKCTYQGKPKKEETTLPDLRAKTSLISLSE